MTISIQQGLPAQDSHIEEVEEAEEAEEHHLHLQEEETQMIGAMSRDDDSWLDST